MKYKTFILVVFLSLCLVSCHSQNVVTQNETTSAQNGSETNKVNATQIQQSDLPINVLGNSPYSVNRIYDLLVVAYINAEFYINKTVIQYLITALAVLLLLFFGKWISTLICYILWQFKRQVGPIIIDEIEDKSGLAILMRNTLTSCGASISNPTVTTAPSATPGFSNITAVLEKSTDIKVKLVTGIFAILDYLLTNLGLKQFGYIVSCVLSSEERKTDDNKSNENNAETTVHIDIEIRLMHNKQLKKSYSIDGNSKRELAKKAAYWIFWYVSGRKKALRRISPWNRFPTFDGYLNYQNANCTCGSQKEYLIKKAIKEAPFNALAHLSLGDEYELKNQYLNAFEVYLEVILMWPHLYGIWYRIAVIFSCPELLAKEWKLLPAGMDKSIDELFQNLMVTMDENGNIDFSTLINKWKETKNITNTPEPYTTDGNVNPDFTLCFISRAMLIWLYLEAIMQDMFWLWINQFISNIGNFFFDPGKYSPFLARYYWSLIPFFPWGNGSKIWRSFRLAKLCSELEFALVPQDANTGNSESEIERIHKDIKSIEKTKWMDFTAIYNLGCYYAIKSGGFTQDQYHKKEQSRDRAIEYIKQSGKDRNNLLDLGWVRTDPDLTAIKDSVQFRTLFDKEVIQNPPKDIKPDILLKYIRPGANIQHRLSNEKSKQKYSVYRYVFEFENQIVLWKSMVNLLTNPENADKQAEFCRVMRRYAKDKEIIPDDKAPQYNTNGFPVIWNNILAHANAQLSYWQTCLETIKSFIQQDESLKLVDDVAEEWKTMDAWQWQYIMDLISPMIN